MTLAQKFAASFGAPVRVGDEWAQPIHRILARNGDGLCVRWIRQVEDPVQGLSISVDRGLLRVAGVESRDIVLWGDTAPAVSVLEVVGDANREISIWNCWRIGDDGIQAWVGNAGMIVEEVADDSYRYRCNSGIELSFEDLVVEVTLEAAVPKSG